MNFETKLARSAGVTFTDHDVQQWVEEVFFHAGNPLTGKPDLIGKIGWEHLYFGSLLLPDISKGVDIRPIKKLVRLICATYLPGPDYGFAPSQQVLWNCSVEARETYWRFQQSMMPSDDDGWSEFKQAKHWFAEFGMSDSSFREHLKDWLRDEVAERKGLRGKIRFLNSFVVEHRQKKP
jgi:hypothetical protein